MALPMIMSGIALHLYPGYSAFGSYEGTGSASTAAFVYTGMRRAGYL